MDYDERAMRNLKAGDSVVVCSTLLGRPHIATVERTDGNVIYVESTPYKIRPNHCYYRGEDDRWDDADFIYPLTAANEEVVSQYCAALRQQTRARRIKDLFAGCGDKEMVDAFYRTLGL